MIKRMILIAILMLSSSPYAEENKTVRVDTNNSIINQELQKAMEQEKKFAKEQTFYNAETYDFKGAEINKASLDNVPLIEMDDADIDSDAILGMSEEEGLSW
jgi:hypothetical protein